MGEIHALAPLPQRTLEGWHRFVASGDRDLLASLLSEHIVFRSPFVQSPIPGLPATVLVLTTVVSTSRVAVFPGIGDCTNGERNTISWASSCASSA